ncbi:MAG: CHAT domain-containing protein [Promethearchaeota archaeon]|nr:MAG: CHAT domain-containing protein [Candidatus Lokiarchaeota archaeon]
MTDLLKLYIKKVGNSYEFSLDPSKTLKVPYIKKNIDKTRKRILELIEIIKENIHDDEIPNEIINNDILKISNNVRELLGIDFLNKIKKELNQNSELLLVIKDPSIPWELLNIEKKPLCLSYSLGKILSDEIQEEYVKDEDIVIRILFIANPLGDLPNTEIEIEKILEQLNPAIEKGYFDKMVLKGAEATTTNIIELMRSRKIDIIHYSGHAFFDESNPENSGLVLADKVLTAKEISNSLEYFPELVFVNACESAQTSSKNSPEDVPGIGQAFIDAGTRTFVGSLWPIDDREAAYFAHNFYQNLLQSRSAGECVLNARKFLYDDPDSIYGWASFMIYGNPNYVPSSFNNDFLNSIERITLPELEEPIKLRIRNDLSLLRRITLDKERKIVPMGVKEEFLDYIEKEEFNIILGPSGAGKTNCKYLLSDNDRDIYFVELDKNYLKGIRNSEAILKVRRELKELAQSHRHVVMVFDEEHYSSDMNEINLIEIVGLLFSSGKPSKINPNLRLLIFLRPDSLKNILKKGKMPLHWKVNKLWLNGIKLTERSMEQLLALHDLKIADFTKPAYQLLKQKTSNREWIYPIFADKLLLYLQNLYCQLNEGELISTQDIDEIHISDEIVETMRFLVYNIRPDKYQKIWNIIANLNKFFKVNPSLWLIKATIKQLNFRIDNINDIIQDLKKDNIIIIVDDEIIKTENYIFAHDIYYDVPLETFDEDLIIMHEKIEAQLKNNLKKLKNIKNPKKLNEYLKIIMKRFHFLSTNPYGSPAENIDLVLEFFSKLKVETLTESIIPYLESLVCDFYSRAREHPESENMEAIAKLYYFIGEYHLNPKINEIEKATDFINICCHILESKNKDSTDYRIKNGQIYDKFINKLDMSDIENQIKVELASWQWKASKQYDKGISTREILVNEFLKSNKDWASAELQWCGEVALLNNQLERAIKYYNQAIELLESEPKHILNIIGHLKILSSIYDQLNKNDEKSKVDTRISTLENEIKSKSSLKTDSIKIYMICGIGDLFVGNQIYHKILDEIDAKIIIKDTPPENYNDIIIIFGNPLTPDGVGSLFFKYLDRDMINKMLSSYGYWIKKPTKENEPLLIAIGGYSMFDTRRAAEDFIKNEKFPEIIKNL